MSKNGKSRQPLDSPGYELLLRFPHAHVRDAFQEHADLNALGITATQDVRGSGGEVDPVRLIVCFPDLDRAKEFEQSGRNRCPIPFDVQGKPRRVATSVQHVLMVQFPDLASQGRLEYMSRTMTMQLFQGVTTEQIQRAVARLEGDAAAVNLSDSKKHLARTMLEWSAVQSAVVRSSSRTTFECQKDSPAVQRLWHVLVGCKHRFPTEETETRQRDALVLSLEHSDGRVQIYQPLREQIIARVRQRARLSAR